MTVSPTGNAGDGGEDGQAEPLLHVLGRVEGVAEIFGEECGAQGRYGAEHDREGYVEQLLWLDRFR